MRNLSLLIILIMGIQSQENRINCRDKDRTVSKPEEDLLELVNSIQGENITLQCHYCLETDDGEPKNWFKTYQPGLEEPKELVPDMDNDITLNRILVNTDHSLTIRHFNENDTGLYSCRKYQDEATTSEFNYFVDLVSVHNTTGKANDIPVNVLFLLHITIDVTSGNLTQWSKYHDENLSPINVLFDTSMGTEYLKARDELKLSMEAMTRWSKWGPCDACGRPKGEAIRKRTGECRIKLRSAFNETRALPRDEAVLSKLDQISCRSATLENVFPGMSNLTKIVPDFVLKESCEAVCEPDKDSENAGWKVGKSKGFKYRKTFVLAENSRLTVVCPESTLENKVAWEKRGKPIKPGDASYPHMYVDAFNTLYLEDVTSKEAGNYTCQVDDIKMQRIKVFVVTKSRFFTGELTRHIGYLAFILFLTVPCYVGGLIIAYWRRKTFKSYEELLKDNPDDAEADESAESLL
ncbi:unnamed protein product [Phyllotreta striolata]|uniref:Ig-like domain-containing protein n=1 Tax=Phyllotreta striolata TaxID=444603 RepID=A0A9N9TU78_PHYSR|nr:unnamed protein product [Phyllotreta striolata]